MRIPDVALGLFFVLGLASACEGRGHGARAEILDPAFCAGCHPDHFREWSGSMHAYAADDPVFRAMNERGQRETGGQLGDFCVRCHAPVAWLEGATTDGRNLDELPQSIKGVTCLVCHTVEAVEGDHNNPLQFGKDLTMRGPFGDAKFTPAHSSAYSPLLDRASVASAMMCGSCHDVVNDHGVHVERTFAEWKESPNATDACGRCHMPASRELVAVADVPGAPARRHHGHAFPAVDLALEPFPEAGVQRAEIEARLAHALQSGICVSEGEGGATIRIVIATLGVGHSFPSGAAQHRRLWTEVVAYRGDEVLYQSGVVPEHGVSVSSADADTWLMRDCLFDEQGAEVHMFWEAAAYKSHTLPPRQPIARSFPPAPSEGLLSVPDRVTLRIRLQPIGLEVLDDLVRSGDLDEAVRSAVPTFDVDLGDGPILEWTRESSTPVTLEDGSHASCVTRTHLDFSVVPRVDSTPSSCTP